MSTEASNSSSEALTLLIAKLRGEPGCCPFCGRDPYHYVDIGVGYERVAVTCCDLGIGLIQYGDEQLAAEVSLRHEAAAALETARAFLEALDRGFFGSDLSRVDLRDTAFIENLRAGAVPAPVFDDKAIELAEASQ